MEKYFQLKFSLNVLPSLIIGIFFPARLTRPLCEIIYPLEEVSVLVGEVYVRRGSAHFSVLASQHLDLTYPSRSPGMNPLNCYL